MGLYQIEAPMDQALALADVLVKCCEQLAAAAAAPARLQGPRQVLDRDPPLENDGDRLYRDAVASLFANGIDPMVVIRWRDIFLRLERAIDATETAAHILEGIVIKNAVSNDVILVIVVGHRARLRLHQRLPRHRERRRDLDLHPRDAAADRGRLRVDVELRGRVHLAGGRGDGRQGRRRRRRDHTRRSSSPGLVGAIFWNLTTWYFGLPSSSSHALIGGSSARRSRPPARTPCSRTGWSARCCPGRDRARRSPSWSGLIAIVIFYRRRRQPATGPGDPRLPLGQVLSGGLLALAHGTNDAQKTMGVITLALIANGTSRRNADPRPG